MTGLADTHCHLDHIERDTQEVLAEASEAGVDLVIDVGMGLSGSRASAERAASTPGVRAAVGIHPNDLAEFEADRAGTIAVLRELATGTGVVAIGETGLDHYRERSRHDLQEEAFRAHIALAKECDKTLVIHCRDAHHDVIRVLDDEGSPSRVVMHCFSGDADFARRCVERSYFCSFAGNLTYKRNDALRDACVVVPQQLLLVETDAPYLAPIPFRGKPNAPALVVHTMRMLASVRSMTVDELLLVLHENTRRAFVI